MKIPYSIPALLFLSGISHAGDLKPFESDGCSAFPEGTKEQKNLWLNCCVEHDKKYWKGGTYEERKMADLELKRCVENVNEPDIAQLMLTGVRVGGSPYFPTSFRWGYGWPYPRGYQPLTDDEKREVDLKRKSESYLNALTQKAATEEHHHE